MCGILGGSNPKWNYQKALQSMSHRGPNGHRLVSMGTFTLGFCRLSIIDLSDRAMQPMLSEDGKTAIVFNGEIYNYLEIKKQLLQEGIVFRTESDTEVILRAYLAYGFDFIYKIDGMFAIAILDMSKKQLFLFRDRMGIKPLYYITENGNIAFASELKCIKDLMPEKSFIIDNTAIYDFLFYQYIPDPKTMYLNVKKLEPASYIVYDIEKNKIADSGKYWNLKLNTCKSSDGVDLGEARFHLKELVHDAVKHQMVADVPVGTFLSGGVDSSVISYECSTLSHDIKAFCTGYKEKAYDEAPFAQEVADAIGIDLIKNRMDLSVAQQLYPDIFMWFDEPFGDTTAYANFLVSKDIRKNVTVALSGDGGDEVFGGYERYSVFENAPHRGILGSIYRKCWHRCGWDNILAADMMKVGDEVEKYAFTGGFGFEDRIRTNLNEVRRNLSIDKDYDVLWHFRKFYHKDLPRITAAQYIDMNSYLPSGMLPKVDRTSMAVSLEVRVPLLDTKVVEYAFSLPQDVRCNGNDLKKILKETYLEYIPRDCLYRKKHGFSVPSTYYTKMGIGFRERILKDMWGISLLRTG